MKGPLEFSTREKFIVVHEVALSITHSISRFAFSKP